VQGIGNRHRIIFPHNDNDAFANAYELRMGHPQSFAARELEDKGPKSIGEALADAIKIHMRLVA